MVRRIGAGFGLVMALIFAAGATAESVTPPDQLVKKTTEEVISAVEANREAIREDPSTVSRFVRELVLPHFDFQVMSQLVLAQNWRDASASQRERFTEQFQQLLIHTYGSSLAKYSGQRIEFLPMQSDPERGRVTVSVRVHPDDGPAIPIDYKLYRTGKGEGPWKVFDVLVDGVSLVQNYRSSFATEVRREGLDALIQRLAERNAAKSGGSGGGDGASG